MDYGYQARLDNLAFTSFPEDYLPYTSPSYQRKAPYLVWDDGGSRFRARRRQFCRSCCCCGTAALASAVALLVAAILAIVAVSVYLGVVTNLFRSPILSISGRFRVMEGDNFEEALLNLTSYEFITKAEYYKTLVENTFLSSSLESAFIAARVYAFRPGSLLVFFRVHLDRRKLQQEDPEVILIAKNLFLEEAIMAPKASFDNMILDLSSIDIREYGDEEWLMTYDFESQPGDMNSLRQQGDTTKTSTTPKDVSSSTLLVTSDTFSSSKSVPFTASTTKYTSTSIPSTSQTNSPPFRSQTSKPSFAVRESDKKENVQYGYAEWKPVALPDPIRVDTLGLDPPPQPIKKDRKQQPGRGSVTIVSESINPQVNPNRPVVNNLQMNQNRPVVNQNRPVVNNPKLPSQPPVSSIMSSVSLMILPNSKNKSMAVRENVGVGVVRAVSPEEVDADFADELEKKERVDTDSAPTSEELEKRGRSDTDFGSISKERADDKSPVISSENKRMDLASFRLLNLDDDDEDNDETLNTNNDKLSSPQTEVSHEGVDIFSDRSDSDFKTDISFEEDFENIGFEGSSPDFFLPDSTTPKEKSEDLFSEDELSQTSGIFDSENEYTSGSEDVETSTINYSISPQTTASPNNSEVKNFLSSRSPLLSYLLSDSFSSGDDFMEVTSESGSAFDGLTDPMNYPESVSHIKTVEPIDSTTPSTTENLTSVSPQDDVFITDINSLIKTIKATAINESLDDVTFSSFLEPSIATDQSTEPPANLRFTIVNHSTSHTEYQSFENNKENSTKNNTDNISGTYENPKNETISSDSSDVFILKELQSKDSVGMEDAEESTTVSSTIQPEENISSLLPQILGVRKIARPSANSNFNRNDINDKNNFDDIFYPMKLGFPATIPAEKPTPSSAQHSLKFNKSENDDDDNIIHRISTVSPPSSSTVNAPIVIGLGKSPVIGCAKGEILCKSGECIPEDYQCNMRRDCRDNSDEIHCSCSEYLAVIGQSQKICDGVSDCWDFSDEEICPWCGPGQFLCPQSRSCINVSQVCDGTNDCPFGADERNCVKLANDGNNETDNEYHSEGYLMVRKAGQWGKLCLDSLNDVARSESVKWKLEDLGKVVCTALTYREVEETTQVLDTGKENQTFFEITSQPFRSNSIFKTSECASKDVVRVKCQSLECGLRPLAVTSSRRRIVGGQSTGSGSWPWQVALYKEGDFQCGAVLVSDSWLISAGHCFFSTQTAYWTARMGILRRGTELASPFEHVRRLVKIILHPDYVDKGFINDIALLKLEKPVPFSDHLRPLCLPLETEDVGLWHGQHCSVVGWGKLYEIGHIFPDSLQEVRLPVISTEECRKRIVFLSMYHITDNMFCAGFERGGRDACLGDSGGPLACQRQDGRWVLLGVTSNGDGCGRPGRPGVYTKVTKYLDWIHSTIQDDSITNITDKCLGHRCQLGRCVLPHKLCDGRFDCADGSDESHCSF